MDLVWFKTKTYKVDKARYTGVGCIGLGHRSDGMGLVGLGWVPKSGPISISGTSRVYIG